MRLVTSTAAIIAFGALIALGARLAVPMVPVPMTMQTFAVLLAGAVLGPWRGAAAVLLYLAAAAAGLPILSDGAAGLAPFAGSTAGYLFAFPLAAVLVGFAFDRQAVRPLRSFLASAAGHVLILAAGGAWLATRIGPAAAIAAGVTPFLIGAAVKSALVALIAPPLRRLDL